MMDLDRIKPRFAMAAPHLSERGRGYMQPGC